MHDTSDNSWVFTEELEGFETSRAIPIIFVKITTMLTIYDSFQSSPTEFLPQFCLYLDWYDYQSRLDFTNIYVSKVECISSYIKGNESMIGNIIKYSD